jgi:hypothetical protein
MLRLWAKGSAFLMLALASACSGARFEAGHGTGGAGGSGGSGKGGSTGKGGSGSGGSGTGGAASGGAAGSGSCAEGLACSPEGSTCLDGSCCPCQYQCQGGKWQQGGCAGCAGPSCPNDPPTDGDSCDSCQDPVGMQCHWDRCADQGASYSATCDGTSWSVQVGICPGGGCCTSDDECSPLVCANSVCKDPAPNGCWRDEDCGPDSICSGASVCPCNADCIYADMPGMCFPANIGCCRNATDCVNAGSQCVSGMCKDPLQDPGSCWTDRDCTDGGLCTGAYVCPCGTACEVADTIGVCQSN